MNSITLIGALLITLALLTYGIGSITLLHFKMVTPGVLWFLTIGIVFNITAIVFMYAGSNKISLSLHLLLGFSALLVMFSDVVLIWRIYLKKKLYAEISEKLRAYSRVAIFWWIVSYITGNLLMIF